MYVIFSLSFLNALGGSPMEMAVVIIAVLLLFGAKSLPQTLRTLGRWSEQLRQISRDIQREINDAGEPFQQAGKEWEETNRPYRVERSSIREDPGTQASSPQPSTKEHSPGTQASSPHPPPHPPPQPSPPASPPGTRASCPQPSRPPPSPSDHPPPSHD